MKNDNKNIGLYVAWLAAFIMLVLAAVLEKQSYNFYTLLRWICCASFVYSAVTAFQMKRVSWTWIFAAFAALFNPIAPFHLRRETWQMADWVAIAVVVIAAVVFWRGNKRSST